MLLFFKNTPKKVYLLGMLISLMPILLMGIAHITTAPENSFNWEIQYDQFYYANNVIFRTKDVANATYTFELSNKEEIEVTLDE